jgi:hypothetical protein
MNISPAPKSAKEIAQGEDDRRDDDDGHGEGPAEGVDLAQQRGAQGLDLGDHRADAPNLRMDAGGHDHPAQLALGDQGARVGHALAVAQDCIPADRVWTLAHRFGLAREGGLLDLGASSLQDAHVRGNAVAGLEQDDVPGHEFPGGQFRFLAVPEDYGGRREHAPDGLHGLFRLAFLNEPDQGVDQDDGQDDAHVHPLVEHGREDGGHQQDVDEHVVELAQEPPQAAALFRVRQHVGAVLAEPSLDLLTGKPSSPSTPMADRTSSAPWSAMGASPNRHARARRPARH